MIQESLIGINWKMIGRQVSDYKIIQELGRGGFGTVYLGENIYDANILVAIKVANPLLCSDPAFVESFKKEYRLLAQLSCPQIVRFQGLSQIDGQIAILMEYLEGESLKERLNKGKITVPESLQIVEEILRGLEYTHAKHILHRDIKPANIYLCKNGRIKLLDFGISKALDNTSSGKSTQILKGSLDYMAPECFENKSGCSSDIYSVGLIMWEMLTGKKACRGRGLAGTMGWHMNIGVEHILVHCPDLSESFSDFVMDLCRKNVEERFQSSKEALKKIMDIRLEKEKSIEKNKESQSVQNEKIIPKRTDLEFDWFLEPVDARTQKESKGKWILLLIIFSGIFFFVEKYQERLDLLEERDFAQIEMWRKQYTMMEKYSPNSLRKKYNVQKNVDTEAEQKKFHQEYEEMMKKIYSGKLLQQKMRSEPSLFFGMHFADNSQWEPLLYEFKDLPTFEKIGLSQYRTQGHIIIHYNWNELQEPFPFFDTVARLDIKFVSQVQLNKRCGNVKEFFYGDLKIKSQVQIELKIQNTKITEEKIIATPIEIVSCKLDDFF